MGKKKTTEEWHTYNRDLIQKMLKKIDKKAFPDAAFENMMARRPKFLFKWDWDAKTAISEETMYKPQSNVLMRQTGTAECHDRDECLDILYPLQDRDMQERGLPDLQYNFYIGGDGAIYEGRGWHVIATKDPGFEHLHGKSYDIAYIGDFTDRPVPKKYVKVRENMFDYLVNQGYLTEEYWVTHLGTDQPVQGINYAPPDKRWDPDFDPVAMCNN